MFLFHVTIKRSSRRQLRLFRGRSRSSIWNVCFCRKPSPAAIRHGKAATEMVVDRLSIWPYHVVTILVNSSIFSSWSRVYCSLGPPSFRLFDAVLKKGDGGVHLAALAFGHDDAKGFHDIFESFEPVASVANDVDATNDAPGDQLAQAGRDVRSAHVEQRADFFCIERRRGDEQERMNLGHRPVDAPSLAHLAPVKHEFLCGWCECHVDSALSGQTVSTEIILARGLNDKSAASSIDDEARPQISRAKGLRKHRQTCEWSPLREILAAIGAAISGPHHHSSLSIFFRRGGSRLEVKGS